MENIKLYEDFDINEGSIYDTEIPIELSILTDWLEDLKNGNTEEIIRYIQGIVDNNEDEDDLDFEEEIIEPVDELSSDDEDPFLIKKFEGLDDPTLLDKFILCVKKKGPITVGKKYQLHKNSYDWFFIWDNTQSVRFLLQIGEDFVERRIQARKDDDTILFTTNETMEDFNIRKEAEKYNL
jgi:hypothetical protein